MQEALAPSPNNAVRVLLLGVRNIETVVAYRLAEDQGDIATARGEALRRSLCDQLPSFLECLGISLTYAQPAAQPPRRELDERRSQNGPSPQAMAARRSHPGEYVLMSGMDVLFHSSDRKETLAAYTRFSQEPREPMRRLVIIVPTPGRPRDLPVARGRSMVGRLPKAK